MNKLLTKLFWNFCSLRLAVVIIVTLLGALTVATFLESLHDTKTAQYWVYKSNWFYGLLALLGTQITAVAVSRWPWNLSHIPFLLAHLGIIILLFGSYITAKFGLDGSMRITEGQSQTEVMLDHYVLAAFHSKFYRETKINWVPKKELFRPVKIENVGQEVYVSRILPYADSKANYRESPLDLGQKPQSAVRLEIQGGPMQIKDSFWVFEGDPYSKIVQRGPATFSFGVDNVSGGPSINFRWNKKDDALILEIRNKSGEFLTKTLKRAAIAGADLPINWAAGVKVKILEFFSNAKMETNFFASMNDKGANSATPAIAIRSGNEEVWLGLGDRVSLGEGEQQILFSFGLKKVYLPFSIKLKLFEILKQPGTNSPATFSSYVETDGKETHITMNEPLKLNDFTFYQASYEDEQPRPITTVLSVNQDPGRFSKYLGSFLIVIGAVFLFLKNRWRKKRAEFNHRIPSHS